VKSECPEVANHSISSQLDGLDKPSVYLLVGRVRLYVLPNPELPETGGFIPAQEEPTVR